jgi:hypothetical protein
MLDISAFKKVERDIPCTFTAGSGEGCPHCQRGTVKMDTWGYTLHVHAADGERDAPCTSTLQERKEIHPHDQTADGGKGNTSMYTKLSTNAIYPHIHTARGETWWCR